MIWKCVQLVHPSVNPVSVYEVVIQYIVDVIFTNQANQEPVAAYDFRLDALLEF